MNNVVSVDIVMITYNQEKYVAQAIESVLQQKCDFPFLLIINDDCSTDNTPNICKEYAYKYPNLILFNQNKSNVGLMRNYKISLEACQSKYVAILEGDDYWIDDCKLKKQAKILESNKDVGLVHSARHSLLDETNKISEPLKQTTIFNLLNQGNVFEQLLISNFISPLTVLFRNELIKDKLDFNYFIENKLKTLDYALWLLITYKSKVVYMKESTAVYRVRRDSISNKKSLDSMENFLITSRLTCKYFINKFKVKTISEKKIDLIYNNILFSHSLLYGDYEFSRKYSQLIKVLSLKDYCKFIISKSKMSVRIYSKCLNFIIKYY